MTIKGREEEGYREDSEKELLNHFVETGNPDFMLKQRMTPDFFKIYAAEYDTLLDRFTKTGSIPTREKLSKTMPLVAELGKPPDPRDVPHIMEDLRRIVANNYLVQVIESMKTPWQEGRIEEATELMMKGSMKINEILNTARIHDIMDPTERYEAFVEQSKKDIDDVSTIRFSHPDLDEHIGGALPGEVHYYVARTSDGKSFSALGDAFHNWGRGKVCAYFSLEMSRNQLGYRADAQISQEGDEPGFSIQGLRKGVAIKDKHHDPSQRPLLGTVEGAEEYRAYAEKLMKLRNLGEIPPLYVVTPKDSRGPITPSFIESICRDLRVDFIIVDQLELLSADSGQRERRLRLGENARDLKLVAERLDVPMLVIHQMNRDTMKTKEVTDINVAESDDIPRNADSLIYQTKDNEVITLKLLKLREGPKDRKFAWHWDFDNGLRTPTRPYTGYEGAEGEVEKEEFPTLSKWNQAVKNLDSVEDQERLEW